MNGAEKSLFSRRMKAAIACLATFLLAGGIWFFLSQQKIQRQSVQAGLLSIAELKIRQIAAWRAERIADANILMGRRGLIRSAKRYAQAPSEKEKSEILRRLDPVRTHYHFREILLVDPDKRILIGRNSGRRLDKSHSAAMDSALTLRRPIWSRLHVGHDYPFPHISILAPLFSGNGGGRPVGALLLISDAAQFLYPLVQSWPTPSLTAETLLVRRDEEDVLFLNELRHVKDTALKLRIPLSRSDLPAARAITGEKGFVEGRDYRGVDVVAAILPVPDSPWFMVSKVDKKEAFAEWRFRSVLIVVFILLGSGLVLAAGLMLYQRQLKTRYRALYQSESELSQSLKRYHITLQAIGDAVISTDNKGRIEFMNPVAERLTGWGIEAARGKALGEVFRIINEETREPMADPVSRVLAEGQVVGLANHTLLISRAGKEIPIADSGSPIRNRQGETFGVVLVFNDQSEERRYQKQLRESEKKYRLLADHTLDVIWKMNMDLEFTYVNPAIRQLTGHDPEQWIGTRLSDHCDEPAFATMSRVIDEELGRGADHRRGVVFETEMLRKDRSPIPVEIHGRVIFDGNGNPKGLQGTARDITERKAAEKKEALLEHRFHQAQKLESIGRLAGGIAHDLNNLLSPIIGYGEMLLEHAAEEDPRREPLGEITSAGERARDLVRQLLAFSRKQTLEFQSVDLNVLLKNFEKLLRRTIREDVAIHMRLAPSLPLIEGDVGQLEQVVMNLAVNAQDAMPDGGELAIETAPVELDEEYAARREGVRPGPHVMLVVTDTGLGMTDDIREHVFEPFFTTKEKDKGTGLGLATVYGIVKQHGGNIWAYSEPDHGSTIKVYLPVLPEPVRAPAPRQRPSTAAADLGGSETILLVEDDAQVRKLARTLLEEKGYTVLAAASGKEALALLSRRNGPVNLLLTDVVMPDMNGKELFESISAVNTDIGVLYMSGYTNDVIAHRGVLDAGIHFIQKPFSSRTLLGKVREVLDSAKRKTGSRK